MNAPSNTAVPALFQGAVAAGNLSSAAANIIEVRDIGDDINNAMGVDINDVTAAEVVLVNLVIDDSSSIRFVAGNTEAVREGHNLVIDSLRATKQKNGIFVSAHLLNAGLVYPYVAINAAPRFTTHNYDPSGGTPLYARTIIALAGVIAKTQDFLDNGIACRTITAIITDGGDNSRLRGASDVKRIVDDMLRSENHIIAGIGIDDGETDFAEVFQAMGIRPEWILTPKNSASEIRKAFGTVSQSATRASQTGAAFSAAAMGGFAAP